MSSTIDVSTLLQNWTVRTAESGSWAALKVEATSENALLIWPLSASNGVSIRFARAARRTSKVGSFLLNSFKGPLQKSSGDTLDREVLMVVVGIVVWSPRPGIFPSAQLTPLIAELSRF